MNTKGCHSCRVISIHVLIMQENDPAMMKTVSIYVINRFNHYSCDLIDRHILVYALVIQHPKLSHIMIYQGMIKYLTLSINIVTAIHCSPHSRSILRNM